MAFAKVEYETPASLAIRRRSDTGLFSSSVVTKASMPIATHALRVKPRTEYAPIRNRIATPATLWGMSKPISAVEVLRVNCARLYDWKRAELKGRRSAARRIGIGEATLNRMLSGEADIRLASIAAFAKWFNLEPWQLLVPDLDPLNPPSIASMHASSVAAMYEHAPQPAKAAVTALLAAYNAEPQHRS